MIFKNLLLSITTLLLSTICISQITITSAIPTESNCPNNGTITVNATHATNQQLLYSIISGPSTTTEQNSNVFTSLEPGNYTIKVSDLFNTSNTQQVTITGEYTRMSLNPRSYRPTCPDALVPDGEIIGNRTWRTGVYPYTWELISPSEITKPEQSSSYFSGLPTGDYTIRVTDACDAFETRSITIEEADVDDIRLSGIKITGCTTSEITLNAGFDPISPFTLEIESSTSPTISKNGTFTTGESEYDRTLLIQEVNNLAYGDQIKATVIDGCNITHTSEYTIEEFCFGSPEEITEIEECMKISTLQVKLCSINRFSKTTVGAFIDYSIQSTDNVINITGTVTEDDIDEDNVVIKNLPPEKTYDITFTNQCGTTSSVTYTAPPSTDPPPEISGGSWIYPDKCFDNTVSTFLDTKHFLSPATVAVTSGPAVISSSKPGAEYSRDITYPDTLDVTYGTTYNISGLQPGVYTVEGTDTCGSFAEHSFEILEADFNLPNVSSDIEVDLSFSRGCNGSNQIHIIGNTGSLDISIDSEHGYYHSKRYWGDSEDIVQATVGELYPGIYTISAEEAKSTNSYLGDPVGCFPFRDTFEITTYDEPKIKSHNGIICGNNIFMEIVADSTSGNAPYEYEIISGPEIFPRQSSNLFELSETGVYRVRIYDNCGNAGTRDLAIENISLQPLAADQTCGAVSIIYPSSEYFTYNWVTPDSTFTGSSLILDAITNEDNGTYTVEQVIEINGCQDIVNVDHEIVAYATHSFSETICPGTTYDFNGTPLSSAGNYVDSVKTNAGCDSLVYLTLAVKEYLTGSWTEEFCHGGSTTVNGRYINNAGTYYDTLTTSGCDSIVTVTILENQVYIEHTFSETICPGTSYDFNGTEVNETGIYVDSIKTPSGCDSLVYLTLNVKNYLTGTWPEEICHGGSTTVNGRYIDNAGIYYDTLTTNACDSIVTVTINFSDYLRGQTAHQICQFGSALVEGVTYNSAGTFYDTLSTGNCDSILEIEITQVDFLRNTENFNLCQGESITLNNIQYAMFGTYHDTITTNFCDSIATYIITEVANPVISLGNDTVLCENQSITYTLAPSYVSYTWNGAISTNNTYSTNTIEDITVSVLDNNNCSGSATTSITSIQSIPILETINQHEICLGDQLNLTASGGSYYEWKDNLATTGTVTVQPENTETYYVTAFNDYGCYSEISEVLVNVFPVPTLYLETTSSIIVEGESTDIIISSTGTNYNITESPTNVTIYNGTDKTIPISPLDNTVYTITSTLNNCTIERSIEVNVVNLVGIPSMITPNSDGLNDLWIIENIEDYPDAQVVLYNRWGNVVLEKFFYQNDFDGKFDGKELPSAVYYYVIKLNFNNLMYNGALSIVR